MADETHSKSQRQQIARLYNKVNQEMYGIGVRKQKVEMMEDKIVIFGQHQRVPALSVIDQKNPPLSLSVDTTLIEEFKSRLKKQLESELELQVKTILKDFDPETEEAAAVIYLLK
ncbi:Na-translocating system protein MpsC family protein [Salibacterium aidingense]|uniref:Na-translocating system protein MpsC family protein n=1 Tax=Salibacterium aidingense TaxID=384933 RepID=UPI0003FDD47F|nr:Na-translocating system protein MpsC family protein [Salibacterium aidingense]